MATMARIKVRMSGTPVIETSLIIAITLYRPQNNSSTKIKMSKTGRNVLSFFPGVVAASKFALCVVYLSTEQ
jgi:hypothetical protein